jgi:two-component system sensor histidine kinase KdpD
LGEGKIYPKERIEVALTHFFKTSNLEKLRELTLRELASQIDLRRRDTPEEEGGSTPDQVMVCLSSRGPNSGKLLRYTSRLAGKLNRNWYAVYVQTQSEESTVIDAQTQRFISDTMGLAKQLGAMVFTYKGEDVADTLLRFAKEYRVGHIVIGRPIPKPLWKRFGKNRDIVKNLIKNAKGVTIIVLDTREEESIATRPRLEVSEERTPTITVAQPPDRLILSRLLFPLRIVIWDQPVRKEVVLRTLTEAIGKDNGIDDVGALFKAIMKREEKGTTFFNEGVAFPHIRLNGMTTPVVAIGSTRQGVSDVSTEKPIELVFLILSPAQTPDTQVQILGLASRAGQNRHLLQSLRSAETPQEAMRVIFDWEASNESSASNLP